MSIKWVIDSSVKADCSDAELANVNVSMNPFDEIAIEETIELKEKYMAAEVVVVLIGVKQAQEAPGDRFGDGRGSRDILIEAAGPALCGKGAIDSDRNATGQIPAALLGWSQGTFASEVSVDGDQTGLTREVDNSLQTIKVNMPTIVTVDLHLNELRYASLPNTMKAKAKPLATKIPADYGVDVAPRMTIGKTVEP